MKKIPRNGSLKWLAMVFFLLLLLLPVIVMAQDAEAPGDAEADESETTVVETEDAVTDEPVSIDLSGTADGTTTGDEVPLEIPEIEEPEPVYEWNFQTQGEFRVEDRANDEGGAFNLLFARSDSDSPDYEYWAFESGTGEDGSWGQAGSIASDSSYIWEVPQKFGMLLSENNKGADEHYIENTNTYPARGIYDYLIVTDEEDPSQVVMTVSVYDEGLTDYSGVMVFCQLAPIGGEKVQLHYDEEASGDEPWANVYTATAPWSPEKTSITKSSWIQFTANVSGISSVVLACMPIGDDVAEAINGSGSESDRPDNRDPHYFLLYAVPTGYELPEGTDLPPAEWGIGNMVGPVIARQNGWNWSRTNNFLWALMILLAVMGYIFMARRGASLYLRRIAGLDHVEEAIGRATEMGRPILYTTGLGYISDIATIASINILGQVARKVADYDSRLINPHRDPIIMAVCQEVLQEAYVDAGRPDAYNKDDCFFITDDQFAYAAAVNGIMVREKPATIFLMGMFYAESLLLAETGASTGAIQIAGTDAQAQLPFFITACDYTLIGEELYAASAYLSREPLLVGSLKGQDLAKLVFMVMTLVGTILICANVEFIQQLFQAF